MEVCLFPARIRSRILGLLVLAGIACGAGISIGNAQNEEPGFRGEGFLEGMSFVSTKRDVGDTRDRLRASRSALIAAERDRDFAAFDARIDQSTIRSDLSPGRMTEGVPGVSQTRRVLKKADEKRLVAKRENRKADAAVRKAVRRSGGRGTRNWYRK